MDKVILGENRRHSTVSISIIFPIKKVFSIITKFYEYFMRKFPISLPPRDKT